MFDILIIGGGFSGTMLAVQLLRHSAVASVAVMERSRMPGRGIAYSSPQRFHLLNVPAGEMSALPDVPDDFLRWARIHFHAGLQERSFPPRSIYGQYVGSLLEETLRQHGGERFRWIDGNAVSISQQRHGFEVRTAKGETAKGRMIVLATGTFPPVSPRIAGLETASPGYFPLPWAPEALEDLPSAGSVLLLGSGLTSVDLIMALKSKGFRGTIHVLSRKGIFPRARRQLRPVETWPVFWHRRSPRTTRGLLRLVRQQVQAAGAHGIDWRAVIDSLRPVSQEIWQSLPLVEQRRFLRHLRVYWDAHRHRTPPEIADVLEDMRAEGQVILHVGRPTQYRGHENKIELTYRDSDTLTGTKLHVTRIINCTGSEAETRHLDDPLISSLFAQGLARPDPLFLGLDVDDHGRLVYRTGTPSKFLYAIGPLMKGKLWETTTVPEIRQQAAHLARELIRQAEVNGHRPKRRPASKAS